MTYETHPGTRLVLRDGYVDVYSDIHPDDLITALETTESHAMGLVGLTMGSLRAFFADKGHSPSSEHWVALWEIANTLETMARGVARAKIYLSAVDPGVGKTQTVLHFAGHLAASAEHEDVGMLITAFTIAEIKSLAEQFQGVRDKLCVLTSDPEANAMGGSVANKAQILITTQARIGAMTRDQSFAAASGLHYRGQPRACRVWDESILPGTAAVLQGAALVRMATRFERTSPPLYTALLDLGQKVRHLTDNAAIDVPDISALSGISIAEIREVFSSGYNREDSDNALFLSIMSGQRVRARHDGEGGASVLSYREELAPDLLPMLVLDASGRVRETYSLWQDSRGNIERLTSAVRDYSPLSIKVWRTAGSKYGWADNGKNLAQGIADTILTKPKERWLMVIHKPKHNGSDAEKMVRAYLPADVRKNLEVTTWGQHTGRNDWSDIPNVILAGTIFYPTSRDTALHHLCSNVPVEGGLVTRDDLQRTVLGESRHAILQAVCRGRVRRSDGDKCQPMTAYIISSPHSGIEGELAGIFPGCSVEAWSPIKVEAKGRLGQAIRWLSESISGGTTVATYGEISLGIKMESKAFNKLVAGNALWKEAVVALGFGIERGLRGALHVRKLTGG